MRNNRNKYSNHILKSLCFKKISISVLALSLSVQTYAQQNLSYPPPLLVQRPDDGNPLSSDEINSATNDLIQIIRSTKYFDFVNSRIHGWPASDKRHPWWGHMWKSVTLEKRNGIVSYTHNNEGTDNAGISTASYLEGACFAYRLWGNPSHAFTMRKMLRAYSAWVLSSAHNSSELEPKVMNRALYPESVISEDSGVKIVLNYDLNRPGINRNNTQYVRLPENPFYGDIYIKNKRSGDDMGQIIRSLALTQSTCEAMITQDPKVGKESFQDFKTLSEAYSRWALDVDQNNFKVPVLDMNGNYNNTDQVFADYKKWNIGGVKPMCAGTYAIRMLHTNNHGDISCYSGRSSLEDQSFLYKQLRNDVFEMLRTHHEAAVAMAQIRGDSDSGQKMLNGLNERLRIDFNYVNSNNPPKNFNKDDVPQFLVAAANVGASLTSNEIRWLHQKLRNSKDTFIAAGQSPSFNVFSSNTPDGEYNYEPPSVPNGLYFKEIGALLGTCASALRNPTRPVFNCDLLQKELSKDFSR